MSDIIIHGCRDCIYKKDDLFNKHPDMRTLAYCNKRFSNVDVDAMSVSCEIYKYDKSFVDKDIKPDKVMDCTDTDFNDGEFDMIFFDPPHYYGEELGNKRFAIRNNKEKNAYYDRLGSPPDKRPWGMIPYYGSDKYKTKAQLIKFVHEAQIEFSRILDDCGISCQYNL